MSLPDGVEIWIVGPECFGLAADFRFRMFADIDPDADHSEEREEYTRGVAGYFERHAKDPGQVLVFAFFAGEALGCAAMTMEERPPRMGRQRGDFAYIHNVYVLPEYRKKGIARALVARLVEEASAHPEFRARRVGLHASILGAPLYASMGFATSEKYMELELSD